MLTYSIEFKHLNCVGIIRLISVLLLKGLLPKPSNRIQCNIFNSKKSQLHSIGDIVRESMCFGFVSYSVGATVDERKVPSLKQLLEVGGSEVLKLFVTCYVQCVWFCEIFPTTCKV